MRYRLLDVLACPVCRSFPLELHVVKKNEVELKERSKPKCEIYCGLLNRQVKDLESAPCDDCMRISIVEGYLVCRGCRRWFPILDGIPELLPDGLRNRSEEEEKAKRLGISADGFFVKG
ncbi:MAG: Trm112 family protein [Nitrososphaeria archaeon]